MINITDEFIVNQYIKRIVPVGMNKKNQIVYYENEIFKDLYFNNNYMISNFGKIYSKGSNIILTPNISKDGYEVITLTSNVNEINRGTFYIHNLVMMTFAYRSDYYYKKKSKYFLIKHINKNKFQNIYCPGHPLHNLEWSDSINYLQYIINSLPKDIDEEFRLLIIDKRYLISNKGKIYSLISDSFLMYKIEDYCRVSICNKLYLVHRLIMMTFAYRPDYENLEVNHKDGNKLNNNYFGENNPNTNLQWCTKQENMQHAVQNNLICHGENCHLTIFKEEFIETVCKLINENPFITSTELASILNIPNNSQFCSLITQLRCGVRWRRIVEKYPNICKIEHFKKYQESDIIEICQIINENPNIKSPEIARMLNIEYKKSFSKLIHRLKNGEAWVNITQLYPNVVQNK